MNEQPLVDPYSAKSEGYREELELILRTKVCPFCPQNFPIWHKEPVLHREDTWLITRSDYPYSDTAHHFLLVGQQHKEDFSQLTESDWALIRLLSNWAITTFGIKGGGLAMRFGDPALTGATVRHIHGHLIVPELNPDTGRAKVVNFPFG